MIKNKFNAGDMVIVRPENTRGVTTLHGQIADVVIKDDYRIRGVVYGVKCGSLSLIEVPEHTISLQEP